MILKDGFNYIEYLKRRKFIGKIRGSNHLIEGLLVPLEVAISECTSWSNQDLSRKELLAVLRQANVFVGSADELRDYHASQTTSHAAEAERLQELCHLLDISNNRIQATENSWSIVGRNGAISPDGRVHVRARTRRHLSGIKRRLAFCALLETAKTDAWLALPKTLTSVQSKALRLAVGLKKRPLRSDTAMNLKNDGIDRLNVANNRCTSDAMALSPIPFARGEVTQMRLTSIAS